MTKFYILFMVLTFATQGYCASRDHKDVLEEEGESTPAKRINTELIMIDRIVAGAPSLNYDSSISEEGNIAAISSMLPDLSSGDRFVVYFPEGIDPSTVLRTIPGASLSFRLSETIKAAVYKKN